MAKASLGQAITWKNVDKKQTKVSPANTDIVYAAKALALVRTVCIATKLELLNYPEISPVCFLKKINNPFLTEPKKLYKIFDRFTKLSKFVAN